MARAGQLRDTPSRSAAAPTPTRVVAVFKISGLKFTAQSRYPAIQSTTRQCLKDLGRVLTGQPLLPCPRTAFCRNSRRSLSRLKPWVVTVTLLGSLPCPLGGCSTFKNQPPPRSLHKHVRLCRLRSEACLGFVTLTHICAVTPCKPGVTPSNI